MPISLLYMVFGSLVVGAGAWASLQNPASKELIPQHKKMIFKKRYWLYYILTFMAGARRQVFIAFAVFLLVKKLPIQRI